MSKKKVRRDATLGGPSEGEKAQASGVGNKVKPGSAQQGPKGNFGRRENGGR